MDVHIELNLIRESKFCELLLAVYLAWMAHIQYMHFMVSLRFVVDLLVNRLDELSQYVVDQGLPPPPMFHYNGFSSKNALKTLGLGHVQLALEKIETKDTYLAYS